MLSGPPHRWIGVKVAGASPKGMSFQTELADCCSLFASFAGRLPQTAVMVGSWLEISSRHRYCLTSIGRWVRVEEVVQCSILLRFCISSLIRLEGGIFPGRTEHRTNLTVGAFDVSTGVGVVVVGWRAWLSRR